MRSDPTNTDHWSPGTELMFERAQHILRGSIAAYSYLIDGAPSDVAARPRILAGVGDVDGVAVLSQAAPQERGHLLDVLYDKDSHEYTTKIAPTSPVGTGYLMSLIQPHEAVINAVTTERPNATLHGEARRPGGSPCR